MKAKKPQSEGMIKLILGLMAFTVCLIPLQVLLLFLSLNRWVALALKLICGHVGVIVLFKWLRSHGPQERPAWFPALVQGALAGAILYLALTAVKFLVVDSALLNLIRVLCPVCFGVIGAWMDKNKRILKEENNNG